MFKGNMCNSESWSSTGQTPSHKDTCLQVQTVRQSCLMCIIVLTFKHMNQNAFTYTSTKVKCKIQQSINRPC